MRIESLILELKKQSVILRGLPKKSPTREQLAQEMKAQVQKIKQFQKDNLITLPWKAQRFVDFYAPKPNSHKERRRAKRALLTSTSEEDK